jgi:hypothetical protein
MNEERTYGQVKVNLDWNIGYIAEQLHLSRDMYWIDGDMLCSTYADDATLASAVAAYDPIKAAEHAQANRIAVASTNADVDQLAATVAALQAQLAQLQRPAQAQPQNVMKRR